MVDINTSGAFVILRDFAENDITSMNFKEFIDSCNYNENSALILLDNLISKNIVKINGFKIVLTDLGNIVSEYLTEEIIKKNSE